MEVAVSTFELCLKSAFSVQMVLQVVGYCFKLKYFTADRAVQNTQDFLKASV